MLRLDCLSLCNLSLQSFIPLLQKAHLFHHFFLSPCHFILQKLDSLVDVHIASGTSIAYGVAQSKIIFCGGCGVVLSEAFPRAALFMHRGGKTEDRVLCEILLHLPSLFLQQGLLLRPVLFLLLPFGLPALLLLLATLLLFQSQALLFFFQSCPFLFHLSTGLCLPLGFPTSLSLAALLALGGALSSSSDGGFQPNADPCCRAEGITETLQTLRMHLLHCCLCKAYCEEDTRQAAACSQLSLRHSLLCFIECQSKTTNHARVNCKFLESISRLDLGHIFREPVAELHGILRSNPFLADDAPDDLLQLVRIRCGTFRPHVLQCLELTSLEEETRHAKRPLLLWNVIGHHQSLDEGTHAVALEAWWEQVSEAVHNLLERTPVWVAIVHDLHQFDGSALNDLVQHKLLVEDVGLLQRIWFEAADVVQVASAQSAKQRLEVCLVLLAN
mmetsp:Transcript_28517/g.51594  ORF Transcript_28517/g.51594 Transcript_28517/m.51594 type:complete len:444 (+) Transcript_28517:772-2103(+)